MTVSGDWNNDLVETIGVGCQDSMEIAWNLRNTNSGGTPDIGFGFGNYANCLTVPGDWDGNGTDTPGLACRPSGEDEIQWTLKNSNSSGVGDVTFGFGNAGSCWPMAGDWDGNGTDTVGLACHPSDGQEIQWRLKNSNSGGVPDATFGFGNAASCRPVVGDWDANGTDTIGLACRQSGTLELQWALRNSNSGGVPDVTFGFGNSGEVSLTSGWAGPGWPL